MQGLVAMGQHAGRPMRNRGESQGVHVRNLRMSDHSQYFLAGLALPRCSNLVSLAPASQLLTSECRPGRTRGIRVAARHRARTPAPAPAPRAPLERPDQSPVEGVGRAEGIRVNKCLKGRFSRRQCDEIVAQGRVRINGLVRCCSCHFRGRGEVCMVLSLVLAIAALTQKQLNVVPNRAHLRRWRNQGIACSQGIR